MKKILHMMFCGLIAWGALVSVAIPVRAQSARGAKVGTGDTSRQLQRENARIARQVDSLKKMAVGVNAMLVYQDSLQGKAFRELQTLEGSPRGRLDRRRIDSLDASVKAQGQKKDSLHHQFDRLLVIIDSTMGVQAQLKEQLKAKRDL